MSGKETSLKEKFRIALTSTAKVISEDFEIKKKNSNKKKNYELSNIEVNNLSNPNE